MHPNKTLGWKKLKYDAIVIQVNSLLTGTLGTREHLEKQKMFMTKVMNSKLCLKANHLSGFSHILLLAGDIYKIQLMNNFIYYKGAVSI